MCIETLEVRKPASRFECTWMWTKKTMISFSQRIRISCTEWNRTKAWNRTGPKRKKGELRPKKKILLYVGYRKCNRSPDDAWPEDEMREWDSIPTRPTGMGREWTVKSKNELYFCHSHGKRDTHSNSASELFSLFNVKRDICCHYFAVFQSPSIWSLTRWVVCMKKKPLEIPMISYISAQLLDIGMNLFFLCARNW